MSEQRFYRMENTKRSVGYTFLRQGDPPLQAKWPEVEAILERRRPPACISRSEAVYVCEDRDFRHVGLPYHRGYVHEVEPLLPIEKRDAAWIGALQKRHLTPAQQQDAQANPERYPRTNSDLTDEDIADRYWNGDASEKPRFEVVTKSAQVVSVDEQLSPLGPDAIRDALSKVEISAPAVQAKAPDGRD